MFALKQFDPPARFNPQGIEELVIGVRILIAPDGAAPLLTPAHNRVGTEILWRLLQARIEQAGVHITEVSRGLPLNRAFYIFTVSELTPALECIKEELGKLRLLDSAQIAWRDPREDVWRIWYPQSGRFESPSDEELADERQLFEKILSAAEKTKESEDELPGQ